MSNIEAGSDQTLGNLFRFLVTNRASIPLTGQAVGAIVPLTLGARCN